MLQIIQPTADADDAVISERSVLKLGHFSGRERARAVEAFERLSPGTSVELVMKQQPGRFVAELQAHYDTSFYWWPLERGPLVWRVILAKPTLGLPMTVATAMRADHLRLGNLWRQFEQALNLCQIERMHRRSAELSLGLRRYIHIEEAVLFPVLEAQTRIITAAPTERMRAEHREISRIVEQFDKLRATADCSAIFKMFDPPR